MHQLGQYADYEVPEVSKKQKPAPELRLQSAGRTLQSEARLPQGPPRSGPAPVQPGQAPSECPRPSPDPELQA